MQKTTDFINLYVEEPAANHLFIPLYNICILYCFSLITLFIIDAKVVNEKLNSFKFESTCHVNDKLVAKAEFIASMVER